MGERVVKPQYFKIALDIASRIARGELEEGRRIYGRSVMSSEYGVSPETIRRAFRILADVKILEIRPQSGAVVLSAKLAREYVGRLEGASNIRELSQRLKRLVGEHAALEKQISQAALEIAEIETHLPQSTPFLHYEISVPAESPVLGKNLKDLQFWQSTGATIIAIRRGAEILLSPGPYLVLTQGDVIVFVGGSETVQTVAALLAAQAESTPSL